MESLEMNHGTPLFYQEINHDASHTGLGKKFVNRCFATIFKCDVDKCKGSHLVYVASGFIRVRFHYKFNRIPNKV
ncbi:hypothetical protein Glove_319g63 [Diversispora epigaea]|uniref:Uncharacterized protein n=1 Tax=Diversispora epigaea TaxID=1348612 RepID=A0A397HPI9_9GLOM|nr:hypothetical protein Glove_319g63 [Diversispora epigaea]